MATRRFKIKYCFDDHMMHVSEEEKAAYHQQFAPLVEIISRAESDKEVMAMTKEYDSKNGTEMFAEAVHLMVYCIACSQFDCDC